MLYNCYINVTLRSVFKPTLHYVSIFDDISMKLWRIFPPLSELTLLLQYTVTCSNVTIIKRIKFRHTNWILSIFSGGNSSFPDYTRANGKPKCTMCVCKEQSPFYWCSFSHSNLAKGTVGALSLPSRPDDTGSQKVVCLFTVASRQSSDRAMNL